MEMHIIEFVRENPMIYDKSHVSYKNQLLKDKKWKEFAKEMRYPVDSLKKRWKSMRDRFYRLRKCEANSDNPERSTSYKYYKSLTFLCGDETSIRKIDYASAEEESDQLMIDYENNSNLEAYEHVILTNGSDAADETSSFATNTINDVLRSNSTSTQLKRNNPDPVEREILNVLKTIKTSTEKSVTPFRTFLESVALTVENANFSIQQLTRLQMSILQAVQYEISTPAI